MSQLTATALTAVACDVWVLVMCEYGLSRVSVIREATVLKLVTSRDRDVTSVWFGQLGLPVRATTHSAHILSVEIADSVQDLTLVGYIWSN